MYRLIFLGVFYRPFLPLSKFVVSKYVVTEFIWSMDSVDSTFADGLLDCGFPCFLFPHYAFQSAIFSLSPCFGRTGWGTVEHLHPYGTLYRSRRFAGNQSPLANCMRRACRWRNQMWTVSTKTLLVLTLLSGCRDCTLRIELSMDQPSGR